jgi:hypothetical protein
MKDGMGLGAAKTGYYIYDMGMAVGGNWYMD